MDFQGLEGALSIACPVVLLSPVLYRAVLESCRDHTMAKMVVSFLAQTALRAFTTCLLSLPIPLGPSPHSLLPP